MAKYFELPGLMLSHLELKTRGLITDTDTKPIIHKGALGAPGGSRTWATVQLQLRMSRLGPRFEPCDSVQMPDGNRTLGLTKTQLGIEWTQGQKT